MKKVMSGAKAHDGKKKKEAGGPAGGPAGPAGGPGGPAGPAGEAGGAGGFNVADALNFGSGNKEGGEGGGECCVTAAFVPQKHTCSTQRPKQL